MAIVDEFGKKIKCPHCKEDFTATVSCEMNATVTLGSEGFMPAEILKRRGIKTETATLGQKTSMENFIAELDDSQRLTIEMAEQNGLLPAFDAAFRNAHGVSPKNVPKAFLHWLRTAKTKLVSVEVLRFFGKEFGGRVDFRASQSVGAVLREGEIVHFVPCQLVGTAAAPGSLAISQTGAQLVANVERWIRTKHGYVIGRGAFMDAMKNKSYGDFCKPGM